MLAPERVAPTPTDGLPQGWFVVHHPGRPQPWTLCKRLHYAPRTNKSKKHGYETWLFCDTLAQAQAEAWRRDG